MRFNLALISSFLLASAVLADHLHSPRSHHRARNFTNAVLERDVNVDSNWAGAVLQQGDGTFNTVTGTFTVPDISGPVGAGAAAWVGIDGNTCRNAILQVGVTFSVTSSGPTYESWYEWWPDDVVYLPDITISAGDTIKLVVNAWDATSGYAVVDNLSNGQSTIQLVSSSHALCGQNAEWIVEDYLESGTLIPLANFGSVAFTNAQASGGSGQTFGPYGAAIFDIGQDGQVLTSVAVGDGAVTVYHT